MRRPSQDDGVLLCFLLELLLHGGWALLGLGLLVLRLWVPVPLFLPLLANLAWVCHAGICTAILIWANQAGNQPPAPKRRHNSYSASDGELPGWDEDDP